MKFAYLINDIVEFQPENNILINRSGDRQSVSLPFTASRCLQLLIEKRTLATQNELIQYAWGINAPTTTPNNLYQNISLLRKAIKVMVGDEQNWIITIPKKGFRLESSLQIDLIDIKEQEGNIHHVGGRTRLLDIIIKTANLCLPYKKSQKTIVLVIFFSLISLFIIFLADKIMSPPNDFGSDFYHLKRVDNCDIYINKDAESANEHMLVFKWNHPNCSRRPYAYITAHSITHSASIISCNQPIESKETNCTSHYIRGFKKS